MQQIVIPYDREGKSRNIVGEVLVSSKWFVLFQLCLCTVQARSVEVDDVQKADIGFLFGLYPELPLIFCIKVSSQVWNEAT